MIGLSGSMAVVKFPVDQMGRTLLPSLDNISETVDSLITLIFYFIVQTSFG